MGELKFRFTSTSDPTLEAVINEAKNVFGFAETSWSEVKKPDDTIIEISPSDASGDNKVEQFMILILQRIEDSDVEWSQKLQKFEELYGKSNDMGKALIAQYIHASRLDVPETSPLAYKKQKNKLTKPSDFIRRFFSQKASFHFSLNKLLRANVKDRPAPIIGPDDEPNGPYGAVASVRAAAEKEARAESPQESQYQQLHRVVGTGGEEKKSLTKMKLKR